MREGKANASSMGDCGTAGLRSCGLHEQEMRCRSAKPAWASREVRTGCVACVSECALPRSRPQLQALEAVQSLYMLTMSPQPCRASKRVSEHACRRRTDWCLTPYVWTSTPSVLWLTRDRPQTGARYVKGGEEVPGLRKVWGCFLRGDTGEACVVWKESTSRKAT